MFHSPQGHDVGWFEAGLGGNGFSPISDYIYVRQCKCTSDFLKKGGLFVIRFDQGEVNVGSPDLQGKSGESSAGADVEAVDSGRWPVVSWLCRGLGETAQIPGRVFADLPAKSRAQRELGQGIPGILDGG